MCIAASSDAQVSFGAAARSFLQSMCSLLLVPADVGAGSSSEQAVPLMVAPAALAAGSSQGGAKGPSSLSCNSSWELLAAEVALSLPEEWRGQQWCHHPGCTNLSGPSEMQLETFPCGGGCAARYCSRECQVQAWRQGHGRRCAAMRGMRSGVGSSSSRS